MQKLKQAVVRILGRELANQISAPFYDWQARRRTRQRLARLPASELLVNLGCGPAPLPGWINVDVARGPQIDIVWDLRNGLPFRDASCTAIFSEHVIEHLTKKDAANLLCECHRALRPAGVLRVSTPDAGRFFRSYAEDGKFLQHPSFAEKIATPLDRINMMMREEGQHLWVYDAESLLLALTQAGFSEVIEQKFGESGHPRMRNIDAQERVFESLYVEAVK